MYWVWYALGWLCCGGLAFGLTQYDKKEDAVGIFATCVLLGPIALAISIGETVRRKLN